MTSNLSAASLSRWTSTLPIALCGLLLTFAVALLLRDGWILSQGSLTGSDPPAHFVSGVMVSDYLHHAFGTNPMDFAESFYVRYPKVAIGHWPPGYYLLQAGWYSLFGAHVLSARLLSASMAALLALTLVHSLRRAYGYAIALGSAAVLLALPLLQQVAWAVMSDLLTGLFVWFALRALAAMLDCARGWRSQWRTAARLVLWSVLALLSKGTAWALLPWLLLTPLAARRTFVYFDGAYWAAVALILVLGAPFYLLVRASATGYPVDLTHLVSGGVSWLERLTPLAPLPGLAPAVVLVLAALGALDAAHCRWWRRDSDANAGTTLALAAAVWIAAQSAFFFVLPLTPEPRAWLPSVAPLLVLSARGLGCLRDALLVHSRHAVHIVPLAIAAALLGIRPMPQNPIDGYRAAADAIPYPPLGALTLVSSDPSGEGAFIVERLIRDPAHAGVVLRGDPMLSASNWSGTVSKPLFDNAEAVRSHLVGLQVEYVVIDGSADNSRERQLLRAAVEGDSAVFHPLGHFAVSDRMHGRLGDIAVYHNPHAGRATEVRVHLGLERGRRALVYRWPCARASGSAGADCNAAR